MDRLSSNKIMQQRFERQKHEIESFVVRIYRYNLIKDGGIIKRKLREKFMEEVKLRRITRIKIDELGWVLMNHDLITRNVCRPPLENNNNNNEDAAVVQQQQSLFKFNMERLRDLLEKHEQRVHDELVAKKQDKQAIAKEAMLLNEKALKEIRDLVEANRPLAEVCYVTTVERMVKHSFEYSSRGCVVCRENFRSPDEYSKHFEVEHGKGFTITAASERFQTTQKLEILHHYDALSPVTLFTIKNISPTAMHVDCVYLYLTTEQLMPINRSVWPITVNPDDTFKFSISTGMFSVAEHDYTILVQFNRVLEYVEQYHFKVLKEPVELKVTQDPIVLGKLKDYPPPRELVAVFKNNFEMVDSYSTTERKFCEGVQSCLKADEGKRLDASNYVDMLHLMNNIEDYNVQFELSRYDMNDIGVKPCGTKRFYSLYLNQFATAPKSLVDGDYIELSYTRPNKSIKTVVGVISQVCANKVLFEMEEPLKYDVKWRIKFTPNRTPIRMEYQALEIVKMHNLSGFFFPAKSKAKEVVFKRDAFEWFNAAIDTNEEQLTAVVNIVNETARPAPFILFGPPGTGKTSTLVEAIAQIWKLKPDTFILVTACSNFACNELTERLLKFVPKEDIFRFFSKHAERLMADMDYALIECSNLNTGAYRLPSKDELYGKRIVVTTLTSAGKLVQAKIKPGHFGYVFIDECGSATEASSLVPIAGILSSPGKINGSIVLAGDPKQLGPIIRSDMASKMGLAMSMLERLMTLDVYQKDPSTKCYDNSMIVKLLQNYRSHEALISFSNKMFYQNELLPRASEDNVNWALDWCELPAQNFPIIFESTMGKFAREKDSASYFNQKEIDLVCFYLRLILTAGINERLIRQQDIGIISPYKKQCIKLKQMCQRHGWNEIDVGSVEAFQGREKPIMILTTVRSGTSGVGFLNNVKRLNVALTRAKALLVVIGNPQTLQLDPNWFEFIRYCHREGAIRGVRFELNESDHSVEEISVKDDYLVEIQQKLDSILRSLDAVKL